MTVPSFDGSVVWRWVSCYILKCGDGLLLHDSLKRLKLLSLTFAHFRFIGFSLKSKGRRHEVWWLLAGKFQIEGRRRLSSFCGNVRVFAPRSGLRYGSVGRLHNQMVIGMINI